MTGIDDAIATLDDALQYADGSSLVLRYDEARDALAYVKNEIVRLQREQRRAHSVLDSAEIGEGTLAGRISKLWGDRDSAENEGDGRESDDYRIDGGRVIPTDR